MLTPIMFLFFFLWAPSGLVIYWLMSNLLGIGQQYAHQPMIGAPVASGAPARRARLKSAGAGRTEGARKGEARMTTDISRTTSRVRPG